MTTATLKAPVEQADDLVKCSRIGCDRPATWTLLLPCGDVTGVCSRCRIPTLAWLRAHPIVKCAQCGRDGQRSRDLIWARR